MKQNDQESDGSEQQEPEPPEQEAEVVTCGGEDGIDSVALAVPEIIAAHAVLGLEMPDDRFDPGGQLNATNAVGTDSVAMRSPCRMRPGYSLASSVAGR